MSDNIPVSRVWVDQIRAERDAAKARVADLEAERDDALKLCRELTEPRLKELHLKDGRVEMTLQSSQVLVQDMAATLLEIFLAYGGTNVVQFTVKHPEHGPFTLSLQKEWGKTALTLKAEAEQARDKAEARVAELVEECNEYVGELARVNTENMELEAALRPFALCGIVLMRYPNLRGTPWVLEQAEGTDPTAENFRAAAKALGEER